VVSQEFAFSKLELRRQDLEGIHLPSFRFSWKLCRVDFFVFDGIVADRGEIAR
jgi:hypothetical protein